MAANGSAIFKMNDDSQEYLMYFESKRLKTFKNWPYSSNCKCTPKKLAKAGFYHIPTENEPDAVRCFYCFKELDGWEPDDEPMKEHKQHSPHCKFLTLETPVEEMTNQQLLRFEMQRKKNKLKIQMEPKLQQYETTYKHVRLEMDKLVK